MEAKQDRWYLRKADIKKTLSSAELERLYQHSRRFLKPKGDMFWIGDEDDTPKVYVVDQGYARICKMSDDGKRFIIAILGPGEFFGALSPDKRLSELEEYLEVTQDLRLIAIDADVFHQVLENHPKLSLRLVNIIDNRRRMLEKRIAGMLFKDVTARTAEFLLEICQKYGDPCPLAEGDIRDLTLTHQEIADIVGATRPVVSNIISQMIKADLMQKHDRALCIKDFEAMEEIADDGVKALEAMAKS